jgi:hypothetical protein
MQIQLVQVTGNLLENLPKAGEIVDRRMSKALATASTRVWRKAIDKAPTSTGTLAKSITRDLRPNYARIYPQAKYGLYVHGGTKAHYIPKSETQPGGSMYRWFMKKGITDKRHQHFILKKIARVGTKAQPWLADTAKEEYPQVLKDFEEALNLIARDLI